MEFPKEFINKCKEIYPDWKELHQKLEEGNVFALRYLDDSRYNNITADDILNAKTLDELQEKAELIKVKEQIYSKSLALYRKYEESDENS